ncbi:hypothetical protein WDZ92_34295 [Nostoc sp. NIES-2111]
MSRAIDLRLQPVDDPNTKLGTYTYTPGERVYRSMAESVYLEMEGRRCRFSAELTPDEARVLANQLLQVADVAEAQKAARVADDELQASFDEICEAMRDAEELGGTGCFYGHPWIHYVPADQVEAKVKELTEAGAKRFMVLAEPSFEEVPA